MKRPDPFYDKVSDFELTQYGFRWGPMHVDRCCSDERFGVVLRVSVKPFPESCERHVDIRISPKGGVISVELHGSGITVERE